MTRIFSTEDWSLLKEISHPGTVNELDFSSDDRYLAVAGDHNARIFRVSDWRKVHDWALTRENTLFGDDHIYINTRFSPDDSILAVGATQGFVYLFDVKSGKLIRRFNKSGQKTETVEWTKDGRHLLVAGHGYQIDFYPVSMLLDEAIGNDSLPYSFQAIVSDALEYMDFNATGTLLTTAHQDGTVQLWTYMSDDPLVNHRRHREVRELQDQIARQAGKNTN